jgi:hypothetical protein
MARTHHVSRQVSTGPILISMFLVNVDSKKDSAKRAKNRLAARRYRERKGAEEEPRQEEPHQEGELPEEEIRDELIQEYARLTTIYIAHGGDYAVPRHLVDLKSKTLDEIDELFHRFEVDHVRPLLCGILEIGLDKERSVDLLCNQIKEKGKC